MLDKITIRNLWSQYVGMCRNFYWKISEILPTDSTYWSYLLIQPTDYRGILMRYIHEVYSWGMLITHEVYPCGILMRYTPEVNSWCISYILNLPTGPTYWFYLPIIEVYSWDILILTPQVSNGDFVHHNDNKKILNSSLNSQIITTLSISQYQN